MGKIVWVIDLEGTPSIHRVLDAIGTQSNLDTMVQPWKRVELMAPWEAKEHNKRLDGRRRK